MLNIRKHSLLLFLGLFPALMYGQGPTSAFSFQAILHNQGAIVSKALNIKVSILPDDVNQLSVYTELHENVQPSPNGLVGLTIGGGNKIIGNFDNLTWGKRVYFLDLEADFSQNGTYAKVFTLEIRSVPLAINAKSAGRWKFTAGAGIQPGKDTVINTGDINESDDLKLSTPFEGDVTGIFNVLKIKSKVVDNANFTDLSIGSKQLKRPSTSEERLLKWNGKTWTPSNDLIGFGLGSTAYYPNPLKKGLNILGSRLHNTGDLNAKNDLVVSSYFTGDLSLSSGQLKIQNNTIGTQSIIDNSIIGTDLFNKDVIKDQVLEWNNKFWVPAFTGDTSKIWQSSGMLEIKTNKGRAFIGPSIGKSEVSLGKLSLPTGVNTYGTSLMLGKNSRGLENWGLLFLISDVSNGNDGTVAVLANGYEAFTPGGIFSTPDIGNTTSIGQFGSQSKTSTLLPTSNALISAFFDSTKVGALQLNFKGKSSILSGGSNYNFGVFGTFFTKTNKTDSLKLIILASSYDFNFNKNNGWLSIADNDSLFAKTALFADRANRGVIFPNPVIVKVQHPKEPEKEIWFGSLSGNTEIMYERNTSKLVNGEARVIFSEAFAKLIKDQKLSISLTPLSAESLGLVVTEKNTHGFSVKELDQGRGNYSFDWEVKAIPSKAEEIIQVVQPKKANEATSKPRGIETLNPSYFNQKF